jgi:hypothetical protein
LTSVYIISALVVLGIFGQLVYGQGLEPVKPEFESDFPPQTIQGNNDTAVKGGVCFQGTDLCFEYYPQYNLQDYDKITQYCIDHADKILKGGNPVQDLVNANLIPSGWFVGKSCDQVNKEVKQLQAANEYYANPDLYKEHENQDPGQEWWRPPE